MGDTVGDTVGLNVGESVSSLLSSESSPSFLIGCFFPELSCSSRRTILADEAELTSMIEIAIAPKNFIVNELDSESIACRVGCVMRLCEPIFNN